MPGDFVSMSTPLAGRDPEFYENPNEVRLDRKPTHVTLGYGIHRCLGQHLARREWQIAMEEFVKVIPEFEVQPGYKVKSHLGNVIHSGTAAHLALTRPEPDHRTWARFGMLTGGSVSPYKAGALYPPLRSAAAA